MIVTSAVLTVVAAVLFIVGLLSKGDGIIYGSIAASLGALAALIAGVVTGRKTEPTFGGVAAGAVPSEPAMRETVAGAEPLDDDIAPVAEPIPTDGDVPGEEGAGLVSSRTASLKKSAAATTARKSAAKKAAPKTAAKKAAPKKAAPKTTARKTAPKKAAPKTAAKKAAPKKAAPKTTAKKAAPKKAAPRGSNGG